MSGGQVISGTSDKQFQFNNKPWIYIASPYTQGIRRYNVFRQLEAKLRLFQMDVVPIDPIPASDQFHMEFCQMHYQTWINYTAEILTRCDGVLRLPGKSSGADGEVSKALNELGIPVFYDYEMLKVALPYWVPEKKVWNLPSGMVDDYIQFKTFTEVITPE